LRAGNRILRACRTSGSPVPYSRTSIRYATVSMEEQRHWPSALLSRVENWTILEIVSRSIWYPKKPCSRSKTILKLFQFDCRSLSQIVHFARIFAQQMWQSYPGVWRHPGWIPVHRFVVQATRPLGHLIDCWSESNGTRRFCHLILAARRRDPWRDVALIPFSRASSRGLVGPRRWWPLFAILFLVRQAAAKGFGCRQVRQPL